MRSPPVSELLPSKPTFGRDWWEKDGKTRNHARFCLPLLMANQAGYTIPSPVTAEIHVPETGDVKITVTEGNPREIDTHSATGSFTIQPIFVLRTDSRLHGGLASRH
jgi:hypothetical protein